MPSSLPMRARKSQATVKEELNALIGKIEEQANFLCAPKYLKKIKDDTEMTDEVLKAYSEMQSQRKIIYKQILTFRGNKGKASALVCLKKQALEGLLEILEQRVYSNTHYQEWEKKRAHLQALVKKIQNHDLVKYFDESAIAMYDHLTFRCPHGRAFKKCVLQGEKLEELQRIKECLGQPDLSPSSKIELEKQQEVVFKELKKLRVPPDLSRRLHYCFQPPIFDLPPAHQRIHVFEPPTRIIPPKKRGAPQSLTIKLIKKMGRPLCEAGFSQNQICELIRAIHAWFCFKRSPISASIQREFSRYNQKARSHSS